MKQKYIVFLSTFFVLCCWTQISEGMKKNPLKKQNPITKFLKKERRNKEIALFSIIEQKKKKPKIMKSKKRSIAPAQEKNTEPEPAQEKNAKPKEVSPKYYHCGECAAYDPRLQFQFEENVRGFGWAKEVVPVN